MSFKKGVLRIWSGKPKAMEGEAGIDIEDLYLTPRPDGKPRVFYFEFCGNDPVLELPRLYRRASIAKIPYTPGGDPPEMSAGLFPPRASALRALKRTVAKQHARTLKHGQPDASCNDEEDEPEPEEPEREEPSPVALLPSPAPPQSSGSPASASPYMHLDNLFRTPQSLQPTPSSTSKGPGLQVVSPFGVLDYPSPSPSPSPAGPSTPAPQQALVPGPVASPPMLMPYPLASPPPPPLPQLKRSLSASANEYVLLGAAFAPKPTPEVRQVYQKVRGADYVFVQAYSAPLFTSSSHVNGARNLSSNGPSGEYVPAPMLPC